MELKLANGGKLVRLYGTMKDVVAYADDKVRWINDDEIRQHSLVVTQLPTAKFTLGSLPSDYISNIKDGPKIIDLHKLTIDSSGR